jgi:hypothetical protein
MRTKYLFVLIICLSQTFLAQTMKIYKTDDTTVDFQLSEVDSISFSTTSLAKLSSSDWICFTNSSTQSTINLSTGVYEEVEDGLKIYGSSTNNAVQLMPVLQNLTAAQTVYLKWKVNGDGNYVNVGVELYSDSDNLTLAGKILNLSSPQDIKDNTWYFTRISIDSGNITSTTSTGNYDNYSGDIISSMSLKISGTIDTFSFQASADNTSYAVLAESKIE